MDSMSNSNSSTSTQEIDIANQLANSFEENHHDDNGIFNVIFVLGGPGSGKGTQCAELSKTYGDKLVHLSVGDLLREEKEDPSSEHGPTINEYIKEGKLVPVDIVVMLILRKMNLIKDKEVFLIDGFPRSVENLEGWNRVVGNKANVVGVLFFDCPEEVLEERLLERGKTSGRADDNAESIKKRFKVFRNETQPIVDLYEGKGSLYRVNTNRRKSSVVKGVHQLLPAIHSPIPEREPHYIKKKNVEIGPALAIQDQKTIDVAPQISLKKSVFPCCTQ